MRLLKRSTILKNRMVLFKTVHDKNRNKYHAKKIQAFFNDLTDEYVLNEDSIDNPTKVTHDKRLSLFWLNSLPLSEDYNKIAKENDLILSDESRLNRERKKTIQKLVDNQIGLFAVNQAILMSLLNSYDVDKLAYQNIIKESPTISRKTALEQSIVQDTTNYKEIMDRMNPDIVTQQYGKYRNIDVYAENMFRKSQMKTDHESAMLDDNVVSKEWVHVPNENTRHESNDGQYVMKEDFFTITNDNTGEVDEMLYPHDSNASFGNICNCYCLCIYYTLNELM